MRPGHPLVVIDLSTCGALVEAARPLRPGSRVEVHLEHEQRRALLKARVTRCSVAALSTETGVTYRAALAFDENCDWVCECGTHRGYDVLTTAHQKPLSRGELLPDEHASSGEIFRSSAK